MSAVITSSTLAAELSVLLDTPAAQLVTVWRTAIDRSEPVDSLRDLLKARPCQSSRSNCSSAHLLIEVTRLAVSIANAAGRESASENLRALCMHLAAGNALGAARLQRELLWEPR